MPSRIPVDGAIGDLEIGVILSCTLFGAMLVQAYNYYDCQFKDPKALKIVVASVIFLETIHSGLICGFIYFQTVTNFGDFHALGVAHWTLGFSIPISNIAMGLVQGFFAYRIHVLAQSWYITIISWAFSLFRVGISLGIAIQSHIMVDLFPFITEFLWLVILSLAVVCAVDILNTSALCYYLWSNKTDIERSRRMIDKLLLWTIETGLITTSLNVLALILLLTLDGSTAFLCLSMFTTKLYSNSLFASLNARLKLRSSGPLSTISLSNSTLRVRTGNVHMEQSKVRQVHIEMGTLTEVDGEQTKAGDSSGYLSGQTTKY